MTLKTSLMRQVEMIRYRDQWDRLYARDPEAQFFQSRDFIEPIVDSKPEDFVYIAVWRADVLVGLMPLWVRLAWDDRRDCYRTDLQFAAAKHWADYNGPLIAPKIERDVISAMVSALIALNWGRLLLKNLRMSQARQKLFFAGFPSEDFGFKDVSKTINGGRTNNLLCPSIDLPGTFEEYLSQLSRNTRQKLRRLLRQLDGRSLVIRQGQSRKDIEIFMDLWVKLWAKKKNREKLVRTYGRILQKGLSRGCLSMPMLERDDQVIGVLANFIDPVKRGVSFFVSARDPDVKDMAVGLLMHVHQIKRFINEDYVSYDFLRGDEPYKLQLGGRMSRIEYRVVRRKSHFDNAVCMSDLSAGQLRTELEFLLKDNDVHIAKIAEKQLQGI